MVLLYNVTSSIFIAGAVIFALAMIVAIVYMIRNWNSDQVQDLDAPVRTYLEESPEDSAERFALGNQ
ncbi:hypothetical protein JOD55_001549 [Arcanobacterium pluranimalium]|uniref:hypothetical protein n=1 Tax=Arcanobacterium pluranimalium TaxID=108028 RepID=UPI00195B4AE0|nr:hypothetical protein [Arcanobacterium pluranimalium]MBM7825722.1 hypothetical protein [Arcanobacterium pluranimalium]